MVIVAVYAVLAANVTGLVFHVIVAVYSVVSAIVDVGVAPVTGAVTPAIAGVAIATLAAVAGNTAVTTPEPAVFVAVAPATVKKSAVTPVNV